MKKLFYMISAVAFMASLASCNKMLQDNNAPATDETPSIDGTTTLTLSASVQQTQTKTYWNSTEGMRWQNGDEVMLLAQGASAKAAAELGDPATTCDFTFNGWTEGVEPEYLVFNGPIAETREEYDSGEDVVMPTLLGEDGYITAELRSYQNVVNKSSNGKYANLSIGKVVVGEKGYSTMMKNVCGLIKVAIASKNPEVEYIKIENLGEAPLTGLVEVDYNDGQPKVVKVLEGKKEVIMKFKNGENMGGTSYYACVLPGTYRLKVTYKYTEQESPVELTSMSDITIVRNEIMDLGKLDQIIPERKITVDFASDQPFTEDIAGSEKNNENHKTYTLKGPEGYQFTINTLNGYRRATANETMCLRLVIEKTVDGITTKGGYIKLPAIEGYALSWVEISGTSTDNKYFYIIPEDTNPFDITSADLASYPTIKVKAPTGGVHTLGVDLSDSVAGKSYYIYSISKNAQISKFVLRYTKVN